LLPTVGSWFNNSNRGFKKRRLLCSQNC